MSARVHQLLDEIREKSVKLKDQVASERAANATLTAEISQLKGEMESREQEINELQSSVAELSGKIESLKEQGKSSSQNTGNNLSNEEIDALVKEIEYCIGQLKK